MTFDTNPTCPYCDHEVDSDLADLWEYDGEDNPYECPNCEKELVLNVQVTTEYELKRVECGEDAHEYDEWTRSDVSQRLLDDWAKDPAMSRYADEKPHSWYVIDTINIELNKVVSKMEKEIPMGEGPDKLYTRISVGDIISVAKMEGLESCIMGYQNVFERFAGQLLTMINDEAKLSLDEQRRVLRAELESMEHWALIKIQGKNVELLGSYTKKPEWTTLANVSEIADKLNINKLRRLAEENVCKLDDWTSYKMIKLERPEVDLGVY
jgi:hypothetical protein